MTEQLLTQITGGTWVLAEPAVRTVELIANRLLTDPNYKINKETLTISTSTYRSVETSQDGGNPFDQCEQDSVAIIPLIGLMTQYSTWYNYGMYDIANFIRQADKSSRIAGVVLLCNSPGGDINAVYQMVDAISNFTKPIVTLVDGNCCSGAMWVSSFTNKIFAMNNMCTIGSIGAMSTVTDISEANEKAGIKIHSIYPPESNFKNLGVREAKEGNYERIIAERTSPLAVEFQNVIKKNRPKLDLSVEGIIAGKDFYAVDALKYKLIDGILNLSESIDYIKSESSKRQTIKSLI